MQERHERPARELSCNPSVCALVHRVTFVAVILGGVGLLATGCQCGKRSPSADGKGEPAQPAPSSVIVLQSPSAAVDFPPRVLNAPRLRCERTDPACVPTPYHPKRVYDRKLPRNPVRRWPGIGACEHDGECWRTGGGDFCAAGQRRGSSIGRAELQEAFCGCVRHECRWFRQERFQYAESLTLRSVTVAGKPWKAPAADSSNDVAEPEPDAESCYRPFKRALREPVHFVVEHKSVAGDPTVTLLGKHSGNAQCLKSSLEHLGPDELDPPIVVRGVLSVVITPLTMTPE